MELLFNFLLVIMSTLLPSYAHVCLEYLPSCLKYQIINILAQHSHTLEVIN